jgi:hypothetical protein
MEHEKLYRFGNEQFGAGNFSFYFRDGGVEFAVNGVEYRIDGNLKPEWDLFVIRQARAAEYPPITDYLDGVVKGDQAQIDAYIAACQAVKNKYPKPE